MATRLMDAREFQALKFKYVNRSGEGAAATTSNKEFGREQFCKVEDASQVDVMFKLAAMSEIRSSPNPKVRAQRSVAHQLICMDTQLYCIETDLATKRTKETSINLDALRRI